MKKIILPFLVVMVSLSSCKKTLLPSIPDNTPVSNFESMWKGFNQWYGLFETRGVNWDSLYSVYRPLVTDQMSNEQLYTVLCQMITPLDDIHVFLQPTSDQLPRYESSYFFRINKKQEDFSLNLVRQKYFPAIKTVDDHLQYGISNDNIGYIHFGEFDKPLGFYENQMPVIMHYLRNTIGIIVDIRNHAGGDDQVSRYVAGWFASSRKLFMTTRKRTGTNRNEFGPLVEWYVDKQGDFQFTKPVKLLTTRWTASAGETFTWAMNTQTTVQQMGDTTAGGFTDVISRELPNGWLYFLGVGDYRNSAGKSEEGKGVAPSLVIRNRKTDIEAGNDLVLQEAINRLK